MLLMALRKFLILRKLRNGCLEGRTALIQLIVDFYTSSFAMDDGGRGNRSHPYWAGMTTLGGPLRSSPIG